MAEALEPTAPPSADPPPTAPAGRSRHASRFAVLTGALIGVAIGAVALAAVLVARGGETAPAWSAWHPSAGGSAGAQEIANHVAPEYRLGREQIALVSGGPLELAKVPVHLATRSRAGSYAIVDGSTVLYTLCGGGTHCTIARGKPSSQRLLLLRREGLELALYSFHYLGVENVVALLPPNPRALETVTTRTTRKRADGRVTKSRDTVHEPSGAALLFRRDQFDGALSAPLRATLPPSTPGPATMARAPEAGLVDAMTKPSLYLVGGITRAQDATTFLVLDEP